mmetsp:Transcript_21461/g.9935  ORF Transcript_21461/g.9935 Transcript_21461/m.9935 type:complete len:93 (+) Transcript_21461:1908-2186(+)
MFNIGRLMEKDAYDAVKIEIKLPAPAEEEPSEGELIEDLEFAGDQNYRLEISCEVNDAVYPYFGCGSEVGQAFPYIIPSFYHGIVENGYYGH